MPVEIPDPSVIKANPDGTFTSNREVFTEAKPPRFLAEFATKAALEAEGTTESTEDRAVVDASSRDAERPEGADAVLQSEYWNQPPTTAETPQEAAKTPANPYSVPTPTAQGDIVGTIGNLPTNQTGQGA